MKILITVISILLYGNSYSQNNSPTQVTPEIEANIRASIQKSTSTLKKKLENENAFAERIRFALDTLEINRYMYEYIKYDYSTLGMRTATYKAAESYDSLLNKYYQELLNRLKTEDKKTLVKAQRAWIAYRDSELELKSTLGKDSYSGGGTIQSLIEAAFYLDIIKKRTIEIFEHCSQLGKGIY